MALISFNGTRGGRAGQDGATLARMVSNTEVWKSIPGHEGMYEVSSHGRVRSLRFINKQTNRLRATPLYLSLSVQNGYRYVGIPERQKVCWLVLLAFVGPRPIGLHAAHINGDSQDDRPENLAWVTQAENNYHNVINGTVPKGSQHWRSVLTELDAVLIRDLLTRGIRNADIAKRFGVAHATISDIRNGRTWNHV